VVVVALGILAATFAAGCGTEPNATGTKAPSIILIVIDTLRADYLGCYGFEGPVSPHLDGLANESVLFDRCSSQAPWTTPSVASMMTSLYPEAHGVLLAPDDPRDQRTWRKRWTRAIPSSTVSLAGTLRDRGYRTGAFIANPFIAKGLGFEQGFDAFDESAALRGDRDSTSLLEAGLGWLLAAGDSGAPTFLYLHLMDVHGPYEASEADFEAIRGAPGLGPPLSLNSTGFGRIQPYLRKPRWAKGRDRFELRLWRGRYASGVHAADRNLGTFFQHLRGSGLWDQQVVVVTSDHGEELFDHGGWDHGFSLHEHQLHVPLMIRLPKGDLGGTRINGLVRLTDLMPTLISLAGVASPTEIVGSSLLPLLSDREEFEAPRVAFATSVKEHPGTHSIFDGRFKLIANYTNGRTRLYDVQADPGEIKDLAALQPALVNRLESLLAQELAQVKTGNSVEGTAAELSQEQLDRLRELGYLQ
jgi:arylsulfatase A-like enzyme